VLGQLYNMDGGPQKEENLWNQHLGIVKRQRHY